MFNHSTNVFTILIKFTLSMVYQNLQLLAPPHSAHIGHSKFEILLVKIVKNKKTNYILPVNRKQKTVICSFRLQVLLVCVNSKMSNHILKLIKENNGGM